MKIVLREKCYVGGALREAGETVEVKDGIAAEFGEPADPAGAEETAASLGKLRKDDLLSLASERGVDVTADNNKDEIIAKILG